jgi:hypothetical protein
MHILLDLDDTLNKFTITALSTFCGRTITEADYPNKGSFDICEAASLLMGTEVTKPEFWNSFDRSDWASVPKSDEYDMILEFAERHGRDNVCILTSPTVDPLCLAGKLDWIHDNLPSWLHRQFLMGPRKHFCAGPDRLLIDDADKNVSAFREHGGEAILVPRAWNSNYHLNTRVHLGLSLRVARSIK